MKIFLRKSLNLNQVDEKQRNCLHLASQAGHFSVVQLLLRSGAKVSKSDVFGRTALIMASYGGNPGFPLKYNVSVNSITIVDALLRMIFQ